MRRATFSMLARNTKAEAITDLLDGGSLELYAGRQPISPDKSPASSALARLGFSAPAFHPPENGVSKAYPLIPEEAAPLAGVAMWFRCRSASNQAVLDGSVGTDHADLVLSSPQILVGTRVTIESFTLTEPSDG